MDNPYLIGALFIQLLIILACVIGLVSKFLGFIFFLVYVGGLMILLRYCVILLPSKKRGITPYLTIVVGAFLMSSRDIERSFTYGLLYSARAIILLTFLLYLVMLSVVRIIDYSSGMIKL